MIKRISQNAIQEAGLLMLRCCFFILVLFSLTWWVNLSMTPAILPVSFVIAASPLLVKRKYAGVILSLLVVCVFMVLSMFVWDYSADGQWYHMPAAWALAHSWNPIVQHHNSLISDLINANLWVDHYSKGMETLAASIIATIGNTEAGKAVNGFFLLITFSLVLVVLSTFWKLTNGKLLFYSLLLSFSPIVCTELFTFYLDFASYDCVIWLLCLLLLFDRCPSHSLLGYIFMTVYIGSSIKTNLTFWMGFVIIVFFLYSIAKRKALQAWRVSWTALFAVVLMIFTIGFNPLITNIEDHQNPIYPFGDAKNDPTEAIVQGAQPKYLVDKSRLEQVWIGMTSRPEGGFLTPYTGPWKITARNLSHSGSMTCNVGGGGLFFVDILLLSLLLAVLCKPSRQIKKYMIFEVLLVLSLFILPYGSCFRYVPFFFLFPIIILLYSEKYGLRYEKAKWLKQLICVLLIVDACMAFGIAFGYGLKNTYVVNTYVQRVKTVGGVDIVRTTNWSFLNKVSDSSVLDSRVLQNTAPNKDFVLVPYQRNGDVWIDGTKVDMDLNVNNRWLKKFIEL